MFTEFQYWGSITRLRGLKITRQSAPDENGRREITVRCLTVDGRSYYPLDLIGVSPHSIREVERDTRTGDQIARELLDAINAR